MKLIEHFHRKKAPSWQGQHDWPHDERTCGRCIWLKTGDSGYTYAWPDSNGGDHDQAE